MHTPRWLPLLHWLPLYRREQFHGDLLASLIVALLLLPQGIAYALLAGLPPAAGLYASILPLLIYAMLGSSMTQSVGPMAVTSAMTYAALAPLASAGSTQWQTLAVWLTLLTGSWLLLLALARLDRLLRLVSAPVLQGFADGVALLIVLGQLGPLLGLHARGETLLPLLTALHKAAGQLILPATLFGLGGLGLLLLAGRPLQRLLRRAGLPATRAALASKAAPALLLLLATAALAIWPHARLATLGALPAGLPSLTLPEPLPLAMLLQLVWPALGIALAGYLQSFSVARQLASLEHPVSSRQELLALGSGNLGAALCGGIPVSGGFSRSAVNAAAGAQTPLAGAMTAGWLMLILLFFAPLLATLPLAWLAATIILAAARLMQPGYAWRLAKAGRSGLTEALPYVATLLIVLFSGAISGILAGVLLALGLVLLRASQPHIAIVGRIPGSEHFRNVQHFQTETWPGLLIVRIDESLFFANIDGVVQTVEQALANAPDTQQLLLSLSAVNHIDLSAADELLRWQQSLAARRISLDVAELKAPVAAELAQHAWLQGLAGHIHLSTHAGVEALRGTPAA
ncbi:SulP family inorganic anion transporter [Chitinilyticum piscinae]|uniref:SulP family inorganic anion transporter n=1 Tax=Chitinilyticum piscinae TaxID=2866724 RepID=A0A8J7FL40_9NEIS|nr:SulP family inorganic anion transporter [Chitinilyticum piscinae]MBE9609765.1 SulP family inorganic anion transporter [Chitinilyticum piscinae]